MKDTSDWTFGRRFFEMLFDVDARLVPEEVGLSGGNPRKPYETVESFKSTWGVRYVLRSSDGNSCEVLRTVGWQRSSTGYYGNVKFADRISTGRWMHGTVLISSNFDEQIDWLMLFKATSELTEAIGGVMYLITPSEDSKRTPGVSYYCPPIGGTIKDKQLPNIGWATFFGNGMFKQEVDANLLRSHGYHVEELAGGYLVLMSKTITDVRDDFATFSKRRAELKTYFRPNLFKITREVGDPPEDE